MFCKSNKIPYRPAKKEVKESWVDKFISVYEDDADLKTELDGLF
jgi:hypothetical protein